MTYIKIEVSNNEITDLFLKELKKYENKFSKKILTEKFIVKNDIIHLSNKTMSRKTINTIRWIDDILDLKFRNNKINFQFLVASELDHIKNNMLFLDKILILHPNKFLVKELLEWTYIKVIENTKNHIRFNFNFYSSLKYSKETDINTKFGVARIQTVEVESHNRIFTIFSVGDIKEVVNIRIHHMCQTSEIFDSLHCDCKIQLEEFKKIIFREGGILIYAHEEGRGLGLTNKINAYFNTNKYGYDTVDAMIKETGFTEKRMFEVPADIIFQKNIKNVNLWTNNPLKIKPLLDRGIKVNRFDAWYKIKSKEAEKYIETKKERMNHYEKIDN